MKKTIAILYGGRSGEHEVSLASAASIARNLDDTKYEILLIGISKEGAWYLQDDEELKQCRSGAPRLGILQESTRRVSVVPGGKNACLHIGTEATCEVDVVFPVLHGTFGEDGTVQGLLEMADIPYIGAGVLGSAIGMDKSTAKALWIKAGLPTVPCITLRASEWASADKRNPYIERAERDFNYPLFVKPSCAGSSVGVSKAADRKALEQAIARALEWDDKILIEPFIKAREIECSVIGNERVEIYTPGEIIPHHEFYDYEAKYEDPNGASLLIPADLGEADLRSVRELALKAYKVVGLFGLARVDFFYSQDTTEFLLNEVNTMPGFTTISMFPKLCEASGLAYRSLLDKLILLALERYEQRKGRLYKKMIGSSE